MDTTYECSVCGKSVIILNGEIIRGCVHEDAGVKANMTAVVHGKSFFNQELEEVESGI